jgi:hypothetical protein
MGSPKNRNPKKEEEAPHQALTSYNNYWCLVVHNLAWQNLSPKSWLLLQNERMNERM